MKKITVLLFLVAPLFLFAQSDSKNCKFRKSIDKFTDDTTFASMIGPQFYMRKVFRKDGSVSNYCFFKTVGNVPTYKGNSIILILESGEKLELPASVDVGVASTGRNYQYTAMVDINDEMVLRLSKDKITDYRIYIFDSKIGNIYQKIIQGYFACATSITNN